MDEPEAEHVFPELEGTVVQATHVRVDDVPHLVEVMDDGQVRIRAAGKGTVTRTRAHGAAGATLVVFDRPPNMVVQSVADGGLLFLLTGEPEGPGGGEATVVGTVSRTGQGLRLATESGDVLSTVGADAGPAEVALAFRADMRARYALAEAADARQAELLQQAGETIMIKYLGSDS